MSNILILLLIILLTVLPIFIGSIFLQIVLSKKKDKFLGLILPAITFLIAIVLIIASYNYSNKTIVNISNNSNGEVISYVEENGNKNLTNNIATNIMICIIYNIPTSIYLVIYFAYSKHRKGITNKNHIELIKMNIQDLE